MIQERPALHYGPTSFTAGRMDFAWEELSEEELAQAYADWEAGKGLIGGDPRYRPGSDKLPVWGMDKPFFRALALDDPNAANGRRLRNQLEQSTRLEIEIGFGRGDFVLDRAVRFPGTLFIGYETKTKATRLLLKRIERHALGNLWISDDDCRFNMPLVVPDQSVDIVHILFPDPWWKDQHSVKRLFSPPFVDLLATKMRSGGLLHFKSDVKEYGEFVSYLVTRHEVFSASEQTQAATIGEHVPTHREFWCEKHGRPVFAYYFKRQ